MRPGLSSYTYTWAVGVPVSEPENSLKVCGLLEKAASMGINPVQFADNLPHENLTEEELDLLSYYANAKNIALEIGGRGLSPELTMECLKVAETIGSPILRMVIDAKDYEPGIPEIIGIIRELIPEFRSRKIRLAIENHDRLKAREFENIILKTDPIRVGNCLDSVNSMGAGEGFLTVSEILIPYTINLLVKDFTIRRAIHKMKIIIEGTPAGKGMLDIPDLIEKVNACKKCSSAILELWTPPENNLESTIMKEERWAYESIEYLKKIP